MRISETFYSISGEGVHAGIPAMFIRLQGCNLRCGYCDTKYAQDPSGGIELKADEIVSNNKSRWVVITGGEPLMQEGELELLVDTLHLQKKKVEIETNGSFHPPIWFRSADSWSVDVKCPCSGLSYGTFKTQWLTKLRKQDQLKFVVGAVEDLRFVNSFISSSRVRPTLLISPMTNDDGKWNTEWLQQCTEFCKENDVRLSLQLHKIIWGNKRGV